MSAAKVYAGAAVCSLALVLSAFLLGLTGTAQAATNLMTNPGFEEPHSSNTRPLGWNCVTQLQQAECAWVDDVVYSGQKAVRLTLPSFAPPDGDWSKVTFTGHSVSWQSDRVPAPAGQDVEVSAMIKGENVVAGQGQNWYRLRVSFETFNAAGTRLQQLNVVIIDGTFEWQRAANRFRVHQDAATMRITTSLTASTGTIWLDDVGIYLVSELEN